MRKKQETSPVLGPAVAVTLSDAALLLGICEAHLRGYITKGELPVCELGGSTRITRASLEQFAADHEVRRGPAPRVRRMAAL